MCFSVTDPSKCPLTPQGEADHFTFDPPNVQKPEARYDSGGSASNTPTARPDGQFRYDSGSATPTAKAEGQFRYDAPPQATPPKELPRR